MAAATTAMSTVEVPNVMRPSLMQQQLNAAAFFSPQHNEAAGVQFTPLRQHAQHQLQPQQAWRRCGRTVGTFAPQYIT